MTRAFQQALAKIHAKRKERARPSAALASIMAEYAASCWERPDALGEILRAWAFPGEGFGCYSTFDVRPEFQEMKPTKREFGFLWNREFDDDDSEAEIAAIKWFKHPTGIEMGWHWDGDGTLAFFVPELVDEYHSGVIYNSDCKKDYDWQFGEHLKPPPLSEHQT